MINLHGLSRLNLILFLCEGRFVITFLNFLGVTGTLCSLRFILEQKTGKEIPESSRLELLKKFLAQFCFIRYRRGIADLNRGYIVDLPLLRTLLVTDQKSWEPSFWKVIDSFSFTRVCKFGSFKNPFARITSLSQH